MRRMTAGVAIVSMIVAMTSPVGMAQAHDDWRRPFRPWHGRRIIELPARSLALRVYGRPYYYVRGKYYQRCSDGYVLVPAPVGAVVSELPAGHRTMVIDGVVYHEYDGVYYKGGPAGYTVVPVIEGKQAIAIAKADPDLSEMSQEPTIVVNVPNSNGSYSPVTLQLAGNGMYIGPKGEVYPNRPTADQLAGMYGK